MEIKLTSDYTAIIDDEDFILIKSYKWNVCKTKNTIYAVASVKCEGKRGCKVYMHRIIMGETDRKRLIDHRDRNGLNNRKSNLRIATHSENGRNRKPKKGSSSIFLGVSFRIDVKKRYNKTLKKETVHKYYKWVAIIKPSKDGRNKYLGSFNNEIDAAYAYDKAAKEYFGEFANLNFK